MRLLQLAGVAIFASLATLLLRELRGALAPAIRLGATVLLFGTALFFILPVVERMRHLLSLAGGQEFTAPVLRAVGIALMAELAATLCRDLGEGTLADGILFVGRVEILLLALPLADDLLKFAEELLA